MNRVHIFVILNMYFIAIYIQNNMFLLCSTSLYTIHTDTRSILIHIIITFCDN